MSLLCNAQQYGTMHGSQVVTVNARYIMHNASDGPLQYGQRGSRIVWQLAPAASAPFHWFAHPPASCTMRPPAVMHACHEWVVTDRWCACPRTGS